MEDTFERNYSLEVGDEVTLTKSGIEEFSKNNWGSYSVPLAMFRGEAGVITEIRKHHEDQYTQYYVTNSKGTVYFHRNQIKLKTPKVGVKQVEQESKDTYTTDHYNLYYTLTEKDIEAGKIKVDAYWVAKQWKTGSRDDSGALWHSLKTIARFGEKNDKAREIKALYNQAKALARIYDVEL